MFCRIHHFLPLIHSTFSSLRIPITPPTQNRVSFQTETQASLYSPYKSIYNISIQVQQLCIELLFIVETDAYATAIRVILVYRSPATESLQHIAFYSKTQSTSEQHYTIYENELLDDKDAFKYCWHYLGGAQHYLGAQKQVS